MIRSHVKFARAVLTRWGRPAPQPVPGEVEELVKWLREEAAEYHPGDGDSLPSDMRDTLLDAFARLTCAADLLAQRYPQPVPVSERLPGPGDCDADGRCWLYGKIEGDWRLINPNNSGVPHLKYCFSHWLPAHALPLPGEVEG